MAELQQQKQNLFRNLPGKIIRGIGIEPKSTQETPSTIPLNAPVTEQVVPDLPKQSIDALPQSPVVTEIVSPQTPTFTPTEAPPNNVEIVQQPVNTSGLIGVEARPRMFRELPQVVIHEVPLSGQNQEQNVVGSEKDVSTPTEAESAPNLQTKLFRENREKYLKVIDGVTHVDRAQLEKDVELAKLLESNPGLASELSDAGIVLELPNAA